MWCGPARRRGRRWMSSDALVASVLGMGRVDAAVAVRQRFESAPAAIEADLPLPRGARSLRPFGGRGRSLLGTALGPMLGPMPQAHGPHGGDVDSSAGPPFVREHLVGPDADRLAVLVELHPA